MVIRLRYGRRIQSYLKIIACVLVATFYVIFLFRESINAFEQNKEKMGTTGGGAAGIGSMVIGAKIQEIKLGPNNINRKQLQELHPTIPLSTLTALSTLNPVYEYSEEIHSATEKDLQQRKEHLNAVCKRYNLQSYYPPNPWEFFISSGHNLVWCNVFKAASSTWMYYFNILAGYDIRFLQRTESQPLELARKRFPRPELNELLESLPFSLSFVFVRDPFSRIVSAYRNKLEGGRNSFYKLLGNKIIRQFRVKRVKGSGNPRYRSGPTFDEFLRFLIEQHTLGKHFDEHWAPVYSFCTPCSVNFTIIGKVETFQRDSEFIIRQAGLESLLLDKLPKFKLKKIGNLSSGRKTDVLVERYFSEIRRDILDQLLKIYRLDFELFDYNYLKYYDIVQQYKTIFDTTSVTSATMKQAQVFQITTTTPTSIQNSTT